MKEKTSGKFTLEKFEIAKLRNQRVIIGGSGDDTNTGGDDPNNPNRPSRPQNPNDPNNPNDPDNPNSSVPCTTTI